MPKKKAVVEVEGPKPKKKVQALVKTDGSSLVLDFLKSAGKPVAFNKLVAKFGVGVNEILKSLVKDKKLTTYRKQRKVSFKVR